MGNAMDLYAMAGRISQAAKCAQEVAEMFENGYDYENASKFYLKASKNYEVDNTPTSANGMLIKWCECQILMKKFDDKSFAELIKAYEKIGDKYLQTPLIKS
jgi:alpha-soluble NSF attachment protein